MNESDKAKLLTLIEEASNQSEVFRKKIIYWVFKRKKNPDSTWLLANLKSVLGSKRITEVLEGQ